MIELVMFDLDGTLVDSAPDIAAIVNNILEEEGLPEVSLPMIRSWIGYGARHTVSTAYIYSSARAGKDHPVEPSSLIFDRLMARYSALHSANCGVRSTVYPGVPEALEQLRRLSVQLAVVTNKEESFARELLLSVGLARWFSVVVGGDTLTTRKPDAAPLRHCLAMHGVSADQALMLGDSAVDVKAARAAGVRAVLVRYGYSAGIEAVLADATVESLAEIVGQVRSMGTPNRTAVNSGTSP